MDIFSSNLASCNGGMSARRKLRYELTINRKITIIYIYIYNISNMHWLLVIRPDVQLKFLTPT